MDVITIESEAFNQIMGKIDNLENKITGIIKETQYPLNERWLDNTEVCKILSISKRLLQMYRNEKKIPFTQVNHKIYYKASDVHKFLERNYNTVIGF